MKAEHVVPEDFPREVLTGSVAGSQSKLLLRKVGDRYFSGLAPDELYERYDACEDVAQQLAVYTQRKIRTEGWGFDEALHRVEMGVQNKVRAGTWDFSSAEITWLMSRTRQIMLEADSNAIDIPPR
jgi:hypothetical protein